MQNWFPLNNDLLANPEYKELPVSHRLYLLYVISEFNWRGSFYQADQEVAAALDVSISTLRRARRSCGERGWVEYRSGFQDERERNVATRYDDVPHADPQEPFSKMPHHSLRMVLDQVRRGNFKRKDALVYNYLGYWRQQCTYKRNGNTDFFITKRKLRELTGIHDSPGCVDRLYEKFQYSGGDHLFEYSGYRRLTFTNWGWPADPDEDQRNAENAERWQEEIRAGLPDRMNGEAVET